MERGSLRTRSQAAPDWSVRECLTLVNEISAIEGEWGQSLASFQKWQQVVENCSVLDVNRSLDQCRKKWDALGSEYRLVKPWRGRYWSFDTSERIELGLPEEFDKELYKAIDKYVKQSGGDDDAAGPDTDPEAQPTTSKYFLQTGPKKQRRRMVRRKRKIEESFQPWKPSSSIIKHEPSTSNDVPELPRCNIIPKVKLEQGIEEERAKMVTKLMENAELVNAIVQGNLGEDVDYKLADLKNIDEVQTDFTVRQGDKLIDSLGNIASTLKQLCDLVEACK